MISKIHGDRLVNLKPVNKDSAIVAFSKGEAPVEIETSENYSEQPFKIRDAPTITENLAGMQFGELVVVGFYGKKTRLAVRSNNEKRMTSYWACRCSCGAYQLVRRKALMGGATKKCEVCRRKEYIRTGKNT